MAKFWRNRWEDIRGNLLWQILVSVCGGGVLTGLAQAVRTAQDHPLAWQGAAVVFVVSALALTVVVLLAARSNSKLLQQGSQLSPAEVPLVGQAGGRFGAVAVNEIFHRISANYSR